MDLPCRLGSSAGRTSGKVRELQGHFATVQRADPLSVHVVECVSNVPEKSVEARYPLYQEVLSQQGVSTRLVVLYVPDYVSNTARLAKTSQMWQVLSRMLPTYDITLP